MKNRISVHLISVFMVTLTLTIASLRVDAGTKDRYLNMFGGFPDARLQGGGIAHPHSESNSATLGLISKYDISVSTGISRDRSSVLVKVTDSYTSSVGGGVYVRCISKRFPCGGERTSIVAGDLSYPFAVTDIILGIGLSLKWKIDEAFEDDVGPRGLIMGVGVLAKRKLERFGLSVGASLFLPPENLAGGFGLSLIGEDLFSFSQIFYMEGKLIPSVGVVVRALNWFRVFVSYHLDISGGFAFVSPRLYLWSGYSSYRNSAFLTIGIAFQ